MFSASRNGEEGGVFMVGCSSYQLCVERPQELAELGWKCLTASQPLPSLLYSLSAFLDRMPPHSPFWSYLFYSIAFDL